MTAELIERMLLIALDHRPHLDPLQIAEVWECTPAEISRVLDRLVEQGKAVVTGQRDVTIGADKRVLLNLYSRPQMICVW
jgi:hypothetical protein